MHVEDTLGINTACRLQIIQRTNVNRSAITARDLLRILQRYQTIPIYHNALGTLFTCSSRITITNIDSL